MFLLRREESASPARLAATLPLPSVLLLLPPLPTPLATDRALPASSSSSSSSSKLSSGSSSSSELSPIALSPPEVVVNLESTPSIELISMSEGGGGLIFQSGIPFKVGSVPRHDSAARNRCSILRRERRQRVSRDLARKCGWRLR